MKKGNLFILVLLLLSPTLGFSQDLYWVGFPNKNNNTFSIQSPEQYLSPKAIHRRQNQQIPITEEDLPVSQDYLDSIKKLGIEILYELKWLNGVVIKPTPTQLEAIRNIKLSLSITSIYEAAPVKSTSPQSGVKEIEKTKKVEFDQSYYGNGYDAISNVSGTFLHQKGFMGQGMLIAIIDDGFYHANSIGIFEEAFSNGRIIATKDFVNPSSDIFSEDSHGTHVFSVIGANIPTKMVGTASEANFVLLRSENFDSEQIVEEYNWAAAAEFADSIGVDIINTSLGYTTFDVPSQDHNYSDLTGEKTPAAIACSIAAKKGMLVVCSAGNEGNKTWKYISTPADAKGIITVGAANPDSTLAVFSSVGPSADGRVKPEIIALGSDVGIISDAGILIQGNGTSYASPIITGMAACLWQAFPRLSANQIREAIITTATQSAGPTDSKGFGIPNARLAYYNLLETGGDAKCIRPSLSPNPFANDIQVAIPSPTSSDLDITIYSCSGECIYRQQLPISPAVSMTIPIPSNIPKGLYIANITCGKCRWQQKLVKQ